MTDLLALLCGLLVGVAVLTAVVGIHGTTPRTPHRFGKWRQVWTHQRLRYGLLATGTAALAWSATGWPVAGLAAAAAVVGLPPLLNPHRPREVIALGEALASWTRRLAELLASGAGGLEQAITTSAATAPEPLTTPVQRLTARIRSDGLEPALRAFADELADPAVDEVAMALILRARAGGRGLTEVLHAQATALGNEVTARREVEADRATSRTTVRALVGITLVMVTGLVLFATDYLAPFDTPMGQGALAVVVLVMVVALLWMHRLTAVSRTTRYLLPRRGEMT